MATFRQRGTKWNVQVRRVDSKPISKTFSTKALAESWAKMQELDIERGVAGLGRTQLTFRKVLEKYRDEVSETKKGGDKESWRISFFLRGAPASLVEAQINARSIPQELRDWRDTRLTQAKPATVSRELAILSSAISYAIKEGWIDAIANPLRAVQWPTPDKPRTQRCTDEELEAIVGPLPSVAPELRKDFIVWMAHLSIETAMRLGEICQLRWSDIDVDRKVIKLVDEWSEDNLRGPSIKNGKNREVPMSRKAINIIQSLSDYFPDGEVTDKIFQIDASSASTAFALMAKNANLGHIRFHDLRREATSRLAKKVPFEMLAKITGHENIKILLTTYYRPDMSAMAEMLG